LSNFALAEGKEIAIVADPGSREAKEMITLLWSQWRPFDVVAISSYPPNEGAPALLADRPLMGGRPTAYVCKNFVCELPVNTPEELAGLL